MGTYTRTNASFRSQGEICRAWHYRPRLATGAAIVMAHGLGGTRDAGLEPFAERFAENGYHVLVFDYRHFGVSDGNPRQLLSIRKQQQDWTAAFEFARTLEGVDPDRIGVWGTSFSGGHVTTLAANDPRVAAVCAQGPMLDGLAVAVNVLSYAGIGHMLRLTSCAVRDQLRAWLGLSPLTFPIVAGPGKFAAMSSDDSLQYLNVTPEHWRNEMTARVMLYLACYRPVRMAKKIKCPVLVQACMKDSIVPASSAVKFAQKLGPRCVLKRYDIGHFDIYQSQHRKKALGDQLEFFARALG